MLAFFSSVRFIFLKKISKSKMEKSSSSPEIDLQLLLQDSPVFFFDRTKQTTPEYLHETNVLKAKIANLKEKLKIGFQNVCRKIENSFPFTFDSRLLVAKDSSPRWLEISRKLCDVGLDLNGPRKSACVLISEIGQMKYEVLGRTYFEKRVDLTGSVEPILTELSEFLDLSMAFCVGVTGKDKEELISRLPEVPRFLRVECVPFLAFRAPDCQLWISKV